MIVAPSAEQEELAALVRRFAAERIPLSATRACFTGGGGHDRAVWQTMAQDLGLQALALPEAYEGAGFGLPELVPVMEHLGAVLYPGPFLSSVGLATTALVLSEDGDLLARWGPRLAEGSAVAALAHAEAGSAWPGSTLETCSDGAQRLTGRKELVVDGALADVLLVSAVEPGDEGVLSLYAVLPGEPGVRVRSVPTLDLTRTLAVVELQDAVGVPVGRLGSAADVLRRTFDTACVLLAAEQLGGAQRCLDMAVDYAKIRTQFDRPIGSFQAVKHRCADMLLDVETARSAVALAVAEPGAETASLALAHCSEVFTRVAAANLQIHGGIGFTWEHDAHLYLKRATSSAALLGSPVQHRERLARALGI